MTNEEMQAVFRRIGIGRRYESFGRDIRYEEGGVFGDNGYVRSNGGRFVDIYDGDIENIPEEYRISSPAVPARSTAPRQTEQPER